VVVEVVVVEVVEVVEVVLVVLVVVVVVLEVVPEVVPLQSIVVQTAWPRELHTQVLQSMVKVLPGVQEEDPEPEPEPELPSTGQEAGQVPSEPGTCSPAAVILVLHQGPAWSTVVHSVYTTPL